MAGNLDRGGQFVGRWPAEGDADRAEGAADQDTGAITEAATGEDRLSQLPAHEIDRDESVGAGVLDAGGTATETGSVSGVAGPQPVPGEEATNAGVTRPIPGEEERSLGGGAAVEQAQGGADTDESGLPMAGGVADVERTTTLFGGRPQR